MSTKTPSLNGWIHESREILLIERNLSDPEVRLFRICRLLAGQYDKYPNSYKKVFLSYREIKRGFLPKWAIGKFTRYINSLEAKGLIKRLGQRVIAVHFIEHNVQNTEKTVHSLEQSVQPTEQSSFTQEERERRIKELRNELAKKKSF
ncbi:hypothetical protein A2W70_00575 [Candidatus Curtissbacteria bacterium RIFCSPLOWO2_02_41_11]|nr:MAG: hypothetical protein A2W70_00575 [Candidatus Curtissbacteria bacterium RIFCSPLOWO2_02_41_11]